MTQYNHASFKSVLNEEFVLFNANACTVCMEIEYGFDSTTHKCREELEMLSSYSR